MQQAGEDMGRVGTLEINQDLRFQRRAWVFERVGWVAMAVVIAMAVAGVFGHGISSKESTSSRDGNLKVEFSRVTRHQSPDTIRLTLAPGAVQGDEARIAFSSRSVDGMDIETVYPEPESVETGADETVFVFILTDEGTLTEIVFNVLFDDVGRRKASVTLEGYQPAEFSQFVLP
jgi:hypothetical protein